VIGNENAVALQFVVTVGVLDHADGWGREEHDAAVHPPPDVVRRPDSRTVLKAPPEAALEAPQSLVMTPLDFPVLFFALTPSVLSTFLSVGTHPCQHGERDHQAHADALARVASLHEATRHRCTGPGGGGGGGPAGGGGGATGALVGGGGGSDRRVYAGWKPLAIGTWLPLAYMHCVNAMS
jgi:uncharacterized membrane protein YgcG